MVVTYVMISVNQRTFELKRKQALLKFPMHILIYSTELIFFLNYNATHTQQLFFLTEYQATTEALTYSAYNPGGRGPLTAHVYYEYEGILYYCIKSDIINNIQLIIHLRDDSNSHFATLSSTVILYYQFNVSVFIQTAIRIMLTHTNVDSFRFTKLTQHSHTMKIVQKIDLFVHLNFFWVFGWFLGALLRLAELTPPDSVNDESD